MNVIDSSCWIEYLEDSDIGDNIAEIVENPSIVLIPTIIIYEVYKKLLILNGKDYAKRISAYMNVCNVVPLDSELSEFSAETGIKYKLSAADSIIYATAIKNKAILWTCDAHFQGLDNVKYFSKKKDI